LVDQWIRYLRERAFGKAEGEREVMIGWFQACEWVKVWRKREVTVQWKVVVRL
jgi:hypothetical protein